MHRNNKVVVLSVGLVWGHECRSRKFNYSFVCLSTKTFNVRHPHTADPHLVPSHYHAHWQYIIRRAVQLYWIVTCFGWFFYIRGPEVSIKTQGSIHTLQPICFEDWWFRKSWVHQEGQQPICTHTITVQVTLAVLKTDATSWYHWYVGDDRWCVPKPVSSLFSKMWLNLGDVYMCAIWARVMDVLWGKHLLRSFPVYMVSTIRPV